jgi:nitrite reductase/ring-hydroxylating ferredoxin subunit
MGSGGDNKTNEGLVGWFQVCWSEDVPAGGVRPIRFFGSDLVAYRRGDGILAVMDAFCLHLGAHLGYGGCVEGNDIVCPYHNWKWGPDGFNTHVPNQERVNRSASLRVWAHDERYGCVFLWRHPDGEAPQWECPDPFLEQPDDDGCSADDYYPAFPNGARRFDGVTVTPAVAADNAVDYRHFHYVHGTVLPELMGWTTDGSRWRSQFGFRSSRTGEIGAVLDNLMAGIGIVMTLQTGRMAQRVMLSTTPINNSHSDLLLTTWIRRVEGDEDGTSSAVMARYDAAAAALPQDIEIWSHQRYQERPLLASYEGRSLGDFRKWTRQFTLQKS